MCREGMFDEARQGRCGRSGVKGTVVERNMMSDLNDWPAVCSAGSEELAGGITLSTGPEVLRRMVHRSTGWSDRCVTLEYQPRTAETKQCVQLEEVG